MITLCLIRHAKANWNHPSAQDIERLLTNEGENEAINMGKDLQAKGLVPNLIISSPAKRAQKTAELIAQNVNYPVDKIDVRPELYEASVEELLHCLENLHDHHKTVFLIGHNPAITMLANYLADDHMINLPTCGVYCIDFITDEWNQITIAEGKTRFIDAPKDHYE
jgi:phosphohistidine phosphatase